MQYFKRYLHSNGRKMGTSAHTRTAFNIFFRIENEEKIKMRAIFDARNSTYSQLYSFQSYFFPCLRTNNYRYCVSHGIKCEIWMLFISQYIKNVRDVIWVREIRDTGMPTAKAGMLVGDSGTRNTNICVLSCSIEVFCARIQLRLDSLMYGGASDCYRSSEAPQQYVTEIKFNWNAWKMDVFECANDTCWNYFRCYVKDVIEFFAASAPKEMIWHKMRCQPGKKHWTNNESFFPSQCFALSHLLLDANVKENGLEP